jgi:subtilisin family serine protease
MKKLFAVLFTLTAAMPLVAQTKSRYLISMRRTPAISALRMVRDVAESTTHNVRTFKTADFIGADLTEAEAAELRSNPDVAYVSPVVLRSLNDVPSGAPLRLAPATEGRYSKTQTVAYGIDLVHARDVWPYTRGKGIVNVAVVDTGVDYNHPDLKDRYMGGYNAWTKTNDPKDDHGHGTHVSGIIAASDNNMGVVGVAPEVRLWAAKVLQSNGTGTDETVMAGIDWVINKKREIGGNWIINLSLGSTAASDPERAIFQRAIDENILVVAAAGNRASRGLDWPAAYDRVVAVSAIDSKSALADFSSFGDGVVFASPGVDVLSTYRVGFVTIAAIESGTALLGSALPLQGCNIGEVTADTVFCGLGKPEEIPANIQGKIALIKRGELQFREKARNALKAGAVAVVIIPPVDDINRGGWTLIVDSADADTKWGVVISASAKDGQNLIDNAGKSPITVSYASDDYTFMSGTSMATPHVAGVAALVWALAPDASAEQIRLAMKLSAFDLGLKGYDEQFGYGRIDALAAAKYVAPSRFGLPPTQDPDPNRRRPSSPHH